MKVAILGDTHIPGRAREIPEKLLTAVGKFGPEKMLVTGDLTSLDVLKRLQKFCPISAVRGNTDFLELPETLSFELSGMRFCMLHGHQVKPVGDSSQLQNFASYFGAKAIVCGHTHRPEIHRDNGEQALVINPGTATGVSTGKASLILAEVGALVDLRLIVLEGKKPREERYRFDVV